MFPKDIFQSSCGKVFPKLFFCGFNRFLQTCFDIILTLICYNIQSWEITSSTWHEGSGLPTAASEGRWTNGGMPRLESREGKIWPRWRRDAVPPQLSCPALWRQQDHVYTCRCICLQLQSHCFGLMPLVVLHAHQTKTWPFQRSLWNWFSSQRFFHGRPTTPPSRNQTPPLSEKELFLTFGRLGSKNLEGEPQNSLQGITVENHGTLERKNI